MFVAYREGDPASELVTNLLFMVEDQTHGIKYVVSDFT